MMTPQHRRWSTLAGALIAATSLTLTGCAQQTPEPSPPPVVEPEAPTPTSTADPTDKAAPTPSASPTARKGGYTRDKDGYPVMPAAATANTKAGAEAFARWYLEMLNSLAVKPTPGAVAPFGAKQCKTCDNFESMLDKRSQTGRRYSTRPLELGPTKGVIRDINGKGWVVQIPVVQKRVDVLNGAGQKVALSEGADSLYYMLVVPQDGSWRIGGIQIEDQP